MKSKTHLNKVLLKIETKYSKRQLRLMLSIFRLIIGTTRADYDLRFEEVKGRRRIELQNPERSAATEAQ
jgi:hypothetical protein